MDTKPLVTTVTPQEAPPPSRVFALNKAEDDALEAFAKKHRHSRSKVERPNIFLGWVPTGIGSALIVLCTHCGVRKNITDYSAW